MSRLKSLPVRSLDTPNRIVTRLRSESGKFRSLTTKVDHNEARRGPIATDTALPEAQVNDGGRQSWRILQPGGLAVDEQVCQAGGLVVQPHGEVEEGRRRGGPRD